MQHGVGWGRWARCVICSCAMRGVETEGAGLMVQSCVKQQSFRACTVAAVRLASCHSLLSAAAVYVQHSPLPPACLPACLPVCLLASNTPAAIKVFLNDGDNDADFLVQVCVCVPALSLPVQCIVHACTCGGCYALVSDLACPRRRTACLRLSRHAQQCHTHQLANVDAQGAPAAAAAPGACRATSGVRSLVWCRASAQLRQ